VTRDIIIIIITIIIIIMCTYAAILRTSAICYITRFSEKQKLLFHRCTKFTEWFSLCTKDFVFCKSGAEIFCII
jgi:hypothetical protein